MSKCQNTQQSVIQWCDKLYEFVERLHCGKLLAIPRTSSLSHHAITPPQSCATRTHFPSELRISIYSKISKTHDTLNIIIHVQISCLLAVRHPQLEHLFGNYLVLWVFQSHHNLCSKRNNISTKCTRHHNTLNSTNNNIGNKFATSNCILVDV